MTPERHFVFIKFFKEESHAEQFLSGKLYCKRLEYFRRLEEKCTGLRADPLEGAFAVLQGKFTDVSINGVPIDPDSIIGPVTVRYDMADFWNLFCLFSLHSFGLNEDQEFTAEQLKEQLLPIDKINELGNFAVVINDIPMFTSMLHAAAEKNNIQYLKGLVKYEPSGSLGFRDHLGLFTKSDDFKNQREFRFAFLFDEDDLEPRTLEIGDIRDICTYMHTSEVSKRIEFRSVNQV